MRHLLKTLLLLALALHCGANDFTPVPGFLAKGGARVWNGDKYGQKLILDRAPDGTTAWQLSWNRELRGFAEIGFTNELPLKEFTRIEFQIPYCSAGRDDLYGCGIRIQDAKGETFQWDGRANDHAPGWKTISYSITPSNFNASWGGDGNKKIDFPAKLIGFGAGFPPGSVGPVWFGEIKYRIPQLIKGVLAADPMWNFDLEQERWWVGGSERISKDTELKITSSDKQKIRLDECMNENRFYHDLRQIRFFGELCKGDRAEVTVIFYDSKKNTYSTSPAIFTVGTRSATAILPSVDDTLRVKEAYVEFPEGGGELVLRKAEAMVEKPLLDAIGMELVTGSPIYVIQPGRLSDFAIALTNTAGNGITGAVRFTFRNLFDETFSVDQALSLKAGERITIPVKLPGDLKFGIWYVTADFTAPGEAAARKVRSFAYMQPAGPTKTRPEFGNPADFLYGICNAPDRWSYRAAEMDAYSAAIVGAKVFRTASPWGYIQRSQKIWDYSVFDRMVKVFGDQGIELQALIAGVPRWAIDHDAPLRKDRQDSRGGKMPQLAPFREYVRRTVDRYKGKIRLWEIGNEPDHPGFASYGPDGQAKLQNAAFEEIRKIDPAIKVMTGGFAGASGDSAKYQIETLSASKGHFDLHAIHLHGPFSSFQRQIDDELQQIRSTLGIQNVAWYPNETAHHSTGGNERIQAETLYTKLIFARARGAVGFTWYNMRDVGFNEMDNEHNYGMQKADFYPKAVFPAYAALVNTFRGFSFDRQLPLTQGEFGFLFRNGDTLALAGWKTSDAVTSGGSYSIATDGKRAERIDLMGNATPVDIENGRLFWTFNTTPETLKVYGASTLTAEPIISCAVTDCAVPGGKVPVRVTLSNPLSRELSTVLTLNPPAEFKAYPEKIELKLAPGETAVRTFLLHCSPTVSGTYGNKYLVDLKADFGAGGVTELALPVNSAAVLSPDINKARPDFELKHRRQVRVLYDNVPNRPYWTGPKDLSAEITIGIDRQELVVKVKVEDDIHLQRQSAEECWRDDSVQFVVWLPGLGGWEIGGAYKEGKTLKQIWASPAGMDRNKALETLKATVSREGTVTDYEFRLPFAPFGLNAAKLKSGFRFNMVVNDSDDPQIGREGWIFIAPGIADAKEPGLYPFVVFR